MEEATLEDNSLEEIEDKVVLEEGNKVQVAKVAREIKMHPFLLEICLIQRIKMK